MMRKSKGKSVLSAHSFAIVKSSICRFVDRYIPGYVFFGDGVTEGYEESPGSRTRPPWSGHGLRVQIGAKRELVRVDGF